MTFKSTYYSRWIINLKKHPLFKFYYRYDYHHGLYVALSYYHLNFVLFAVLFVHISHKKYRVMKSPCRALLTFRVLASCK